ncbi:TolC family outer membrane protein [Chelatococcus asaccharovorans]|uniref:TolC family outer membrane protein n=1 Tax=Chelatococcus asaccharovorans TaxID=28210 RepID=UPI00224C6CB4|nr:TolC family outer membrane protein [Chelatococcus asaccharovorans]CAH1661196.1 Outer membrane efflux protein BepC [Chelatococcus asaccharovorans]CAH1683549.1 Outer membrane efflux protein BepC [Chelatococcus asaccharovorans]
MRLRKIASFALISTVSVTCNGASAETLASALAQAYVNNSGLNAERAGLKAIDEGVPQALAGYRPTVAGSASYGINPFTYEEAATRSNGRVVEGSTTRSTFYPGSIGIEVQQKLFDGGRTLNSVRAAESQVMGGRATLLNTEQSTLYNAATAYMDVLRDTAALNLQHSNVEVLEEQLRQTQDRFRAGEVTQTDVAQAEASLASGRGSESSAVATLKSSVATYQRVIGHLPQRLAPGAPAIPLLPKSREAAIATALASHPAIRANLHAVDTAELQVKVKTGKLAPSIAASASASVIWDDDYRKDKTIAAEAALAASIPIYEGGLFYSQVRQAKENVTSAHDNLEITRAQIRQQVEAAWADMESSREQIAARLTAVSANEIALAGVREEAKVGQRTTLDILNQQQALLNARVNLVSAQRDFIVATYAALSASGKLTAQHLSLKVPRYDPTRHYRQVRDAWGGLRTPDGQ